MSGVNQFLTTKELYCQREWNLAMQVSHFNAFFCSVKAAAYASAGSSCAMAEKIASMALTKNAKTKTRALSTLSDAVHRFLQFVYPKQFVAMAPQTVQMARMSLTVQRPSKKVNKIVHFFIHC